MAENDLPDQVLVEIGGNYELVDRKNLITPESVSPNFEPSYTLHRLSYLVSTPTYRFYNFIT